MIEKISQKETVSEGRSADFRAKNFVVDLFEPSDEYVNGEKRLDYSYRFPKGDVLTAREDDNGIAKIVISRDGKILIDFQEFSGFPQCVFVTPRWLIKNKLGEARDAGYSYLYGERLIAIGDFRDIRHIFAVLHEIGHARMNHRSHDGHSQIDLWQNKNMPERLFSEVEARHFISQISEEEREAWAEALRIAREIKKSSAIDLFGVFTDKKEFRDFVYGALVSHRMYQGKKLSAAQRNFLETVFGRPFGRLKELFNEDSDEKFLEKFFDKRRLWRVAEEAMDEKSA